MKTLFAVLAGAAMIGSAGAQHDHGEADGGIRAADLGWTRQPVLLPAPAQRGERGGAVLRLQGIRAGTVTVFAPDGPAARRQVDYPVGPGGVRIAPAAQQIGNYHWIVAREETPGSVKVASTAWYFANPGASPREMLGRAHNELEIVPNPLPREHGSYRESEKWRFLVRFKGRPLPSRPLTLETELGSRSVFFTDAAGVATVLFPRDFVPARNGSPQGHGPARAGFVLTTEADAEGTHYLTAFNLTYGADGDRDRSLGWGAAFGLAGMLAAAPLLRRKRPAHGDAKHA